MFQNQLGFWVKRCEGRNTLININYNVKTDNGEQYFDIKF